MTEPGLSFQLGQWQLGLPDFPVVLVFATYTLLLVCTVCTSYLSIQRLKGRPWRRRLVSLGNISAMLLIAVLMLDIQQEKQQRSELYLLTPGFTTVERNSFSENDTVLALVTKMNAQEELTLPNNAKRITNLYPISSALESNPSVNILGNGLAEKQWQELRLISQQDFGVKFFPSELGSGLIDVTWQKSNVIGQRVKVSGSFQSRSDGLYELSIIEPSGAVLDTTVVKPNERFVLDFVPKASGFWRYNLRVESSDVVLYEEPVSVYVETPEALNTLIKQSAPSFETRHVQNWLSEYGNQITVVTQISREKHLVQHINRQSETDINAPSLSDEVLKAGELTAELLQKTDLLLMDGRAFVQMPKEQKQLVEESVNQGLGVLLILDETLFNFLQTEDTSLSHLLRFDVTEFDSELAQSSYQSLINWGGNAVDFPIPTSPYHLHSETADALAYDNREHPVVLNQKLGKGHIALSTISHSYQWKTAGAELSYGQFWQMLVSQVARRSDKNRWLEQPRNQSYSVGVNYRLCAKVDNEGNTANYLTPTGTQIDFAMTVANIDKSWYCGYFQPTKAGWYQFRLSEKSELQDSIYLYVNSDRDWMMANAKLNHDATLSRVKTSEKSENTPSYKPFNKLPIGLLLIACLAGLWIERRNWMR
ncbi:hypothetical protein EYS14_03725 [Alteromonadaceae bacterium M269]|nr:hypothetical protein EYS14_03725 [Alteromonadaceae bacterium M269]